MVHEESECLPQYVTDLRAWISAWFDHAVSVGFIRPPFILDETIADRLEGYFKVGLTPVEGADVFFGVMH
ncbi:MAG TPA: hypothetical protein VG105_08605 [Paraburkholderia sp.]|jgi:hypothetical protein|nr:hypothetical protein [Paraburkholderia sp.]